MSSGEVIASKVVTLSNYVVSDMASKHYLSVIVSTKTNYLCSARVQHRSQTKATTHRQTSLHYQRHTSVCVWSRSQHDQECHIWRDNMQSPYKLFKKHLNIFKEYSLYNFTITVTPVMIDHPMGKWFYLTGGLSSEIQMYRNCRPMLLE